MKFAKFVPHLTESGFSDKEAKVYLACLESGSCSVAAVAERAGIKRPTAYVVLKSLADRGLIQPATEGKKSNISAIAPHRILEIIEDERRAAESRHGMFKTILPELSAALAE